LSKSASCSIKEGRVGSLGDAGKWVQGNATPSADTLEGEFMKIFQKITVLLVVYAGGAFADPGFVRLTDAPSELQLNSKAWNQAGQKRRLEHTLEIPQVQFQQLARYQLKAVLPEAKSLMVPQMPEVPFLLRHISLRPGYTASAILDNIKVDESSAPVALKQINREFVWAAKHSLSLTRTPRSRYFPGKWISTSVRDGVLTMVVFPVQYDRQTGKVLSLRSAEVWLNEMEQPSEFRLPRFWSSPSLIITSDALMAGAKLLQKFHSDTLGIRSEIVTVETLAKSESPISEDELPPGYKSSSVAEDMVYPYDSSTKKGYNYELARKIIHYLQGRMADGGSTKYVTLLGDAHLVPPSYYFSTGGELGVTDQCYGALKQCLDPKVAVGRLPFRTVDEVTNYLAKAKRWLAYAAQTSSELSLYGGKAFPTNVYVAELGTLAAINSSRDNWRGVQKFFRTKKNYTKSAVLNLVEGKGTSSFVYYLDHGGGNTWGVESESVSSSEILQAVDAGPEVNPIVASVACTDAAYDQDLLKSDIFSGSEYGAVSVGVAMLKSKAGAVAYLGSSRPALGQPVYNVDSSGNLSITGTTFGLQLLDNFLAKYETAKGGRLGDSLLKALQAYVYDNGNDMSEDDNRYAFFNQELLGDPVLMLPSRQQVEQNLGFPHSVTKFDSSGQSGGFPRFELGTNPQFSLSFDSSAQVLASLIKIITDGFEAGEQQIQQSTFSGNGKVTLTPPTDNPEGNYFLRLENQVGVPLERQVWFQVGERSFEEELALK